MIIDISRCLVHVTGDCDTSILSQCSMTASVNKNTICQMILSSQHSRFATYLLDDRYMITYGTRLISVIYPNICVWAMTYTRAHICLCRVGVDSDKTPSWSISKTQLVLGWFIKKLQNDYMQLRSLRMKSSWDNQQSGASITLLLSTLLFFKHSLCMLSE